MLFESSGDKSAFFAVTAATSLAFFAMVGFEDSVNMAEECQDPGRDFPKMMLSGLGITGLIYVLANQDVLPRSLGKVHRTRRRPWVSILFTTALSCAFLAGPWARSEDQQKQYVIAGGLLVVGLVLWLGTWLWNRGVRAKRTGFRDVDSLSG